MKQKPNKPYKNIHDCRSRIGWLYASKKLSSSDFWPCFTCLGRGKVYNPEDHDPVEGYKMADIHSCPHCVDGNIGYKAFKKVYATYVSHHREEVSRWREEKKILELAYRKLTPEEIKVIESWNQSR